MKNLMISNLLLLPPPGDCKISNASSRSKGRGWLGIIWRGGNGTLRVSPPPQCVHARYRSTFREELFHFRLHRRIYPLRIQVGSWGGGGVGRRGGPSQIVHTYIATISSTSLCKQVCTKIHFRLLLMSLSVIVWGKPETSGRYIWDGNSSHPRGGSPHGYNTRSYLDVFFPSDHVRSPNICVRVRVRVGVGVRVRVGEGGL